MLSLQSRGYTRGVSKSQFKRVLDFSGLPVTLNEFKVNLIIDLIKLYTVPGH